MDSDNRTRPTKSMSSNANFETGGRHGFHVGTADEQQVRSELSSTTRSSRPKVIRKTTTASSATSALRKPQQALKQPRSSSQPIVVLSKETRAVATRSTTSAPCPLTRSNGAVTARETRPALIATRSISSSPHSRRSQVKTTAADFPPTITSSRTSSWPSASDHTHDDSTCSSRDVISPASQDEHGMEIVSPPSEEVVTTFRSNKELFQKAYQLINPGPFFRFICYLYAERKLFVLFFVHALATLVIWGHFALIKFEEQKMKVPEGAPYYWWKRIAPPLEFGSMHAILFQMALIPLTMSRYSVAALSGSVVDRFVPLNRVVRMHIHFGYVMIGIVFVATVFFFAFFGLLCKNGEQAFCDKFTSEIMCTGYGIMATMLIIAGTSYFRHRIPYEVFYVIHHLVFVMYAITIAHTFDNVHRDNERNRSQTFKWFSATLLYYICDRAAMHLNHRYNARLISSSAIVNGNGSRMLFIKLRRPVLFQFKPGQYAFLKLNNIDRHWHPFSIASGPSSSYLEFYIEVFEESSWTGKLWKHLNGNGEGGFVDRIVEIEIMGPYGTSLAKTSDFSHILATGAGTGIVPILSLFKQHVRQLLRLAPEVHFKLLEDHQEKMLEVELAGETRKGSVMQQLIAPCRCSPKRDYDSLPGSPCTKQDYMRESIKNRVFNFGMLNEGDSWREIRRSTKELRQAAYNATRSIYGVVALCLLPILGVALFSMTISWNTIPIDQLYPGMILTLKFLTVAFQACFLVVALFVWDGSQLFALIDLAVGFIAPCADIFYFYKYDTNGSLSPVDILTFSLLTGYMTVRVWAMAVRPRRRSWKSGAEDECVRSLERLELCWVSRSAPLIAEILPDIDKVFGELVQAWGYTNALKVCRISVYCTDENQEAVDILQRDLSSSSLLYQQGVVKLGRPKFGEVIEDFTLELIANRRSSYSLIAFCGSPQLAEELHRCKISNDMVTAITGHKKHQMEFISESYGGVKKSKITMAPDAALSSSLSEDAEQPSVRKPKTSSSSSRRTTTFLKEHSY